MIEQQLRGKVATTVSALYGTPVSPESVGLEKTKKEIGGDYTILVFPFVKLSRKSPEQTAAEIGARLQAEVREVENFSVIKGFLNLKLRDDFWLSFMRDQSVNPGFGFSKPDGEAPVLVEFSSPNTNKPLHLGHIRNNLLGASVAEILKANGREVVKMNLVNDRGIHICKSMVAYRKWGEGETPVSSGMKGDHLVGKYYVLFDKKNKEEAEMLMVRGIPEDEAAKSTSLMAEAQETLRRWEDHDPAVIETWTTMNGWVYAGFDETYRRLGISFDRIQYESQTYKLGKELVTEGLRLGRLMRKEDGSIWADLTGDGLDEKLLLRADGTSVYMTQDLGTAQLRHDEFHPSSMIYVVGNEQNYHFDVLRLVLKKLDRDWYDAVFHLSYGMVELPHGKMKSREGTVVDADDLTEEMVSTAETMTRELGKAEQYDEKEAQELFRMIGLGALKYFILKVDPKKNMLFDPRESIDFNGNTGPFIQYTHARIKSLLEKAGKIYDLRFTINELKEYKILGTEKEILRQLYQFPLVVKEAGAALSPALIANFVYELAKTYNQFYQETPVLKEERESVIRFRLVLSAFTADVIRKSMSLLGIDVPERM